MHWSSISSILYTERVEPLYQKNSSKPCLSKKKKNSKPWGPRDISIVRDIMWLMRPKPLSPCTYM